VPFFAGYYSKDIILEAAWGANTGVGQYAFWLGIAAAFMTAFYSWRLIIMTFHGAPRASAEVMSHVHESPPSMTVPLILLAIGAVLAGVLGVHLFVGDGMAGFWRDSILILPNNASIEAAHGVPLWVKLLPIAVAAIGVAVAYIAYMLRPDVPGLIVARMRGVYLFMLNKWYFDELFDRLFVRPAHYLGRGLWKSGDGALIDGVGPDGIAAAARGIARRAGALQTGFVYHYAFAILIGVASLVTLYLLTVAG
jgi:NADH-quinone oxidoreductase subunit L